MFSRELLKLAPNWPHSGKEKKFWKKLCKGTEKTRQSKTSEIHYTLKQGCDVSIDLIPRKDFCDDTCIRINLSNFHRQTWTSAGYLSMLNVKYIYIDKNVAFAINS